MTDSDIPTPNDIQTETHPPATRSITWHPPAEQTTGQRRKTALFRRTSRGWILQHIRQVTTRQRGETTSELDADAQPADLPPWIRQQVGLDNTGGMASA